MHIIFLSVTPYHINPIYTGCLKRFRIQIKLNRIHVHVNTLIRIVNRFT